jgi:uncharacterized membrane protein YkvA (DUF1232 family)
MKTTTRLAGTKGQLGEGKRVSVIDRAESIDEYIDRNRRAMSTSKMSRIRELLPALSSKALQAVTEGRYDLVIHIDMLKRAVGAGGRKGKKPLTREMEEAGVAVDYLIRGVDAIPDFVEGIGLADDEIIVRRVLERNPSIGRGTSWSRKY